MQVDCGNGVESYGKRKKRQAEYSHQANVHYRMNPDKLIYDSNLRQDVLQNNTPLRKQIFVDPGIRVNRFTADENVSTADGSINGPGSKAHLVFFLFKASKLQSSPSSDYFFCLL